MSTSWPPDTDRQQEIVRMVVDGGSPTSTYFVLLALSTLIASFGLVSDSTATVIGAMIVAPLMGPILALALGLVRGDLGLVRTAGGAEVAGVVAVLLTSMALGLLLGPANLDYGVGEIQGRIRPTLYDMGIGFAAGLAGGFAMVNARVSASIAGVAIAVALVPPLSVSGLMLAGWTSGQASVAAAGQAFLLFLANFVTIEVAAGLVFAMAGLGRLDLLPGNRSLRRGLLLNLLLLVALGVFLALQLRDLVAERFYRRESREYFAAQVPRMIPGGSVEDLTVRRRDGRLEVRLSTRAPQSFTPKMTEELATGLRSHLGLPPEGEVDLLVGTGLYEFVTPGGPKYVPEAPTPDPEATLNQRVDQALREALGRSPGAELVQWNRPDAARPEALHVTVRSPYVFDAYLVGELQRRLRERTRQPGLELTVRTMLGQDFTAAGPVEAPADRPGDPSDTLWAARRQRVTELLDEQIRQVPGAFLVGVEVREAEEGPVGPNASPVAPTPVFPGAPAPLEIEARVQSPRPLPPELVQAWRASLEDELETALWLTVDNPVGARLEAGPP